MEGITLNQCSTFLTPEGLKIWYMKKTRIEDVTIVTCIYNREMQICTAKDKIRPNIWNEGRPSNTEVLSHPGYFLFPTVYLWHLENCNSNSVWPRYSAPLLLWSFLIMNGAFACEERKEEEGSQLIKAIFPGTFAAIEQSKYHTWARIHYGKCMCIGLTAAF